MNSKIFLSFMLATNLILRLNPSLMAETTIQEPQATLNPAAEITQAEQPEKTVEMVEALTKQQHEKYGRQIFTLITVTWILLIFTPLPFVCF